MNAVTFTENLLKVQTDEFKQVNSFFVLDLLFEDSVLTFKDFC